jgi:hypothetical protein
MKGLTSFARSTREKLGKLEDKLDTYIIGKFSGKKSKLLEDILEAFSTCYYSFNLTSDYITTQIAYSSGKAQELNPLANLFIQNLGPQIGLTLFVAIEATSVFGVGYGLSKLIEKNFNKKFGKTPYLFRKLPVYVICTVSGTTHLNAFLHNLTMFKKYFK